MISHSFLRQEESVAARLLARFQILKNPVYRFFKQKKKREKANICSRLVFIREGVQSLIQGLASSPQLPEVTSEKLIKVNAEYFFLFFSRTKKKIRSGIFR